MIRDKRRWAATMAAGIALAIPLTVPAAGQAAEAECPASFRVLHDDHIGKLSLPAGKYTITLLDADRLTCEKASRLFTRFLEDYDGNLPGPWKVRAKRSEFVRGKSGVGFRVTKGAPSGGGGGGGKHPAKGGRRCPSTFDVLHNDRIGDLRIPKGPYYLTRRTSNSPSCERIFKLFAKFLERPDGDIPGWRINAQKGQFVRNKSGGKGFRIKPA